MCWRLLLYGLTYLVVLERVSVALERLFVITVGFMDDAIDMPADMRCYVESDTLLDELDAFLLPVHVCEDKTLHGCGL